MVVKEGYGVEPFYGLPNLTNVILMEPCSLNPNFRIKVLARVIVRVRSVPRKKYLFKKD